MTPGILLGILEDTFLDKFKGYISGILGDLRHIWDRLIIFRKMFRHLSGAIFGKHLGNFGSF